MNRKIRKFWGILYYLIIFVSLFLLLCILQKKIDSINEIHLLYSRNVIEVRTRNIDILEIIESVDMEEKKEKLTIVCEELHPFLELKGIYYSGDLSELPVIQGRFLTSEECKRDTNKAVVGQQYAKEIYERDNRKYYKLDGNEYEVVGILGRESGSRFNTMIFLPLKKVAVRYGLSGTYLVDGEQTDRLFQSFLHKKYEMSVRKLYNGYVPDFLREVKEDNGMIGIYVIVMLLIVMCSLLGVSYFLQIKSTNIKGYKILGIPVSFVVRKYILKHIVVLLCAFAAGTISSELFRKMLGIRLVNYHIVITGVLIFYLVINIEICLKVIFLVKSFYAGESE